MEFLNKTNNGGTNSPNYFGMFVAIIYGCSFLTDILCISLIVLCRAQLQSVEVYILLMYQVFTLVNKIFSSILLTALNFKLFVFGNQTCILTYPFIMALTISLNVILVFFALYHYSSIKQVKHRSILYTLTRNVICFSVFTLITVTFSLTITVLMFRTYRHVMITESTKHCIVRQRTRQILILLGVTIMPLLAVLLIYTLSIHKLVIYIKKRINLVAPSEQKRFKRLLKVSLKFLSFSFLPFCSCLVRFTAVAIAYFCTGCHPWVFLFLQFCMTLNNVIEPTLLICIHVILKRRFRLLLLKGFSFFS